MDVMDISNFVIALVVASFFLIVVIFVAGFRYRYWLRSQTITLTESPITKYLLPALFGFYSVCYEEKGDDWDFFTRSTELHEAIYFYGLLGALLFIVVKGIADNFAKKGDAEYIEFANGLIALAARAIESKIDRFKRRSRVLQKNSSVFESITNAESQIKLIIDDAKEFLQEFFALKEEQIAITIIHKNGKDNKSFFLFDTNSRATHSRTKASVLLENESSLAYSVVSQGEPLFVADKVKMSAAGRYHLSERDIRFTNGSVYCFPVEVTNIDYKDQFVISIATYGKLLCNNADTDTCDRISIILREVCRRLELELTLYAIKKWKET